MSDPLPPVPPSLPRQHPGPPSGWRPISGLAVTSFVLSLVLVITALAGIWFSELVPLGLGVLTLTTVKAGQRRGRALAMWAIVIAVCAGSCSFALNTNMRSTFGHMAESVLSALSAEGGADQIEEALRPWIHGEVLEEDAELLAKIRGRYAETAKLLGEYQDRIEFGTSMLGFLPLFAPPQGVVEIPGDAKPPEWKIGSVVWLRAHFERGTAYVGIRLSVDDEGSMPQIEGAKEGDPVPIVRDIRFFRDATDTGGADAK